MLLHQKQHAFWRLINNSMEHSLSWEANSCSDSQASPCLLWNLKIQPCSWESTTSSYLEPQ
jgi:hypothetical protein